MILSLDSGLGIEVSTSILKDWLLYMIEKNIEMKARDRQEKKSIDTSTNYPSDFIKKRLFS